MLKKIPVNELRLGMFIQELCGSWMDHPFWKKSFNLTKPEELQTLQTCGLQEVWIDTSKGLDVASNITTTSVAEEKQKVGLELQKKLLNKNKPEPRVAMHKELDRARKLGNAINVSDAGLLVDEINLSISRNPEAFLNIARLKNVDDYTYLHSVAVCALMIALGKQLSLSGKDIRDAGIAGLLHDVGKIMIPNEILNKPGKLTDEEFEIIKTHPRKGWEVLSISQGANTVALDVCLHHHERVDGTGYPERLSGEPLTLFARMGAVCDVYDALTSNRSYKNGWEPAEAIRKMAEWKDGHFDEIVFHAFVKAIGIYPSGSLVKLKSGRLAVVIQQSEKSLLTPLVKAFFSTKSNEPIVPELIDLTKSQEAIANIEDPIKWNFDLKYICGF
jgi:HD-GYP domain-containing protein (c-di-GMP phosphodiesterase class II)